MDTKHITTRSNITGPEVERLKQNLDEKAKICHEIGRRQASLKSIAEMSDASIIQLRKLRQLREFFDGTTTRIGGYVVLIVLSGAIPLVALEIARLPFSVHVASITAISVALLGLGLFLPKDVVLDSTIGLHGAKRDSAIRGLRDLETQYERAYLEYSEANKAYKHAYSIFHSRLNQLRRTDWQGLTGVPFENFLAELFTEYGFSVQTTKVTGDQGVDLILCMAERKIAVQAKGYPNSTVGNSAVQEAHTGMVFYDCQAALVITNSTFTSAARQLAAKVGCLLIDGGQIPALIEGEIKI